METLTIIQQALALLSGAVVGFSLGLIGGGGSILAVPLLLYVVGFHDAHVALGTTAAAVSVTAFANLIPHWRAGHVRWKVGLTFALVGAAGAVGGAALGKSMPGKQLLFFFALLMFGVALTMLRSVFKKSDKPDAPNVEAQAPIAPAEKPSETKELLRAGPFALLVGALSGFFGIGGGFLIVPGLIFAAGMPIINAIGTSLLAVGAFGATTAISYALAGQVNWPLALEYVIGGIVGGWLGAWLASRLSVNRRALTLIFIVVIIAVALYMFYVNAVALGLLR